MHCVAFCSEEGYLVIVECGWAEGSWDYYEGWVGHLVAVSYDMHGASITFTGNDEDVNEPSLYGLRIRSTS